MPFNAPVIQEKQSNFSQQIRPTWETMDDFAPMDGCTLQTQERCCRTGVMWLQVGGVWEWGCEQLTYILIACAWSRCLSSHSINESTSLCVAARQCSALIKAVSQRGLTFKVTQTVASRGGCSTSVARGRLKRTPFTEASTLPHSLGPDLWPN